jgi:nitrate/TMAO reductase-like tetraheme cytochrome c subunit
MEHSIFKLTGVYSLFIWACLACALVAAVILLWFLFVRPQLVRTTKILLLFGIGVFPIGSALTGNVVGFHHTMDRSFCNSCHTMGPYVLDSQNPDSTTLASMHAKNPEFGGHNCYTCHADYGMFGVVSTKISGMRHLWEYFAHYRDVPVADALPRIHLYTPYPNANCMHCHSTRLPGWVEVDEHNAAVDLIRSGELSCTGAGCHGPAHPFSKPKELSR